MCRADIAPSAEPTFAQLLTDMAAAICERDDLNLDDVRIGPVDFGPEVLESSTPLLT